MEQVPAHLHILQEEGETQAGKCCLRDHWPPVGVGTSGWPLCNSTFNQVHPKFQQKPTGQWFAQEKPTLLEQFLKF